MLGTEERPSQSTVSRFLAPFRQSTSEGLTALHRCAVRRPPSERGGYRADPDSWALLHEDGRREGVRVGCTRPGLKPCHRPLVAVLAEGRLIANVWLRRGDSARVTHAAGLGPSTLAGLPAPMRVARVRADGGFWSTANSPVSVNDWAGRGLSDWAELLRQTFGGSGDESRAREVHAARAAAAGEAGPAAAPGAGALARYPGAGRTRAGPLAACHYLVAVPAVGGQRRYAVSDAPGAWVAVVIFAATARYLCPREQRIGWSAGQRRRRLTLVANNVRFLLSAARTVPNLRSTVLSRVLARLSDDGQACHAHPVPVVTTFVGPARLGGTV